jgi:DNA-binding NarL/FixJ family response regulator
VKPGDPLAQGPGWSAAQRRPAASLSLRGSQPLDRSYDCPKRGFRSTEEGPTPSQRRGQTSDQAASGARIRILVVEASPVVRDLIRLACEAEHDLDIIGEAGSAEEAFDLWSRLLPDVLVVDADLPGQDGFELVEQLRSAGSDPSAILMFGRLDAPKAYRAARMGIRGALATRELADRAAGAIRAVAGGEWVYGEDHDRMALAELQSRVRTARERSKAFGAVTARELQVLDLLTEGATTRQVASRLGLSPRTVETHISKLYRKLGVASRTEAVMRGMRLGLLRRNDSDNM